VVCDAFMFADDTKIFFAQSPTSDLYVLLHTCSCCKYEEGAMNVYSLLVKLYICQDEI
jgi:hypothetical protein